MQTMLYQAHTKLAVQCAENFADSNYLCKSNDAVDSHFSRIKLDCSNLADLTD